MPKRISVIIPCKDESLGTVCRAVNILNMSLGYSIEVLVIENGSAFLRNIDTKEVQYHYIAQAGLGLALKLGIAKATYEDVFFLPADMSYDLSFVHLALAESADMVIASKFVKGAKVERPFVRKVASRAYHWKNKIQDGIAVNDVTGAKLYRRTKFLPLLDACPSSGIAFEVELIKAAQKNSLKIVEIPAIVRDYGNKGILRWL